MLWFFFCSFVLLCMKLETIFDWSISFVIWGFAKISLVLRNTWKRSQSICLLCVFFDFWANEYITLQVYLAQIVIEDDCVSLFEIRIHFTKWHVKIKHSNKFICVKEEKKKRKLAITRLHLAVNDLMTPNFVVLLFSQAQTTCKSLRFVIQKIFSSKWNHFVPIEIDSETLWYFLTIEILFIFI